MSEDQGSNAAGASPKRHGNKKAQNVNAHPGAGQARNSGEAQSYVFELFLLAARHSIHFNNNVPVTSGKHGGM